MSGGAGGALCVMLSGGGRTLVNLCGAIDAGRIDVRIGLVIASRACLGAERARERGLTVRMMEGELSKAQLAGTLRDAGCSWVALAGYLRIAPIPEGFAGRMINIHPALLPSFGGRGMHGLRVHQAVLDAGCKVSGCSVHLCDDRYDTGPIVAQRACPVHDDDTPESLAERVFALECAVYPGVVEALTQGRIVAEGRRARIAAPTGAP